MTLEMAFLFALLAAMVYLFMTEKIPVDLTAFLGLVILVLADYLTPEEAFTGFASPAVITMLAIFIVSGALLQTGVADVVGSRVHALVGSREIPLIILIMATGGILSAFMNNIAATAVLMPAVFTIARSAGISPSKLFIPLSFGAILGGTTTMVGTPPNILVATMLRERDIAPFGLFDFTPVGLTLLAVGIVFMITIGRRLLPAGELVPALDEVRDLSEVYQLHERLFSIHLPHPSSLDGLTIAQARLGALLGVQVVGIVRGGRLALAPEAQSVLRSGDVLVVEGPLDELEHLFRVRGVELQENDSKTLPPVSDSLSGLRARLAADSPLCGQDLRQLRFRDRFGVMVVGIERDGALQQESLADVSLRPGDVLLALGSRGQLEDLGRRSDFETYEVGSSAAQQLHQSLFVLRVPDGSPLAGTTVGGSRLGELMGLTVGGIVRDGETLLAVTPDEVIRTGDRLLVAGEASRIVSLLELGDVRLDIDVASGSLESDEVGVVEAILAPRSSLSGRTLAELGFRDRYGLQVLAIWREGRLLHGKLAEVPLEFGDALLLQGARQRIEQLSADPDFVVLASGGRSVERRTKRAPVAVAGLLLMIGMVVSGFQPIHVAAFTAAVFVVLTGALRMDEAYRAIEWRAIFLVAAVLPVGIAMERTGAAELLADNVIGAAGALGPYAVLAALVLLSSMLSQGLDGAPAVVLLTPVALEASQRLGLSPYPVMMGVGLAASAAFMTPFSHKANLLVMGAGGYRSLDYLRVGTPLTVILLALIVLLVPVFFPF